MTHEDEDEFVRLTMHTLTNGQAAVLTFNRPASRNPLDGATVRALEDQLNRVLVAPEVRGVILTGSPPAFSAGGDLEGYIELYQDDAGFREFLAAIGRVATVLDSSHLVSIAAINGVCVAGGLELMLACDLAVIARDARIGDAHVRFWQLPGGGGSQRLPRAVGARVAKDLILTGRMLTAQEAADIHLVTSVADGDVVGAALTLMDQVIAAPVETIRLAKQLAAAAAELPLAAGLAHEREAIAQYVHGADSVASLGLHRFLARHATS